MIHSLEHSTRVPALLVSLQCSGIAVPGCTGPGWIHGDSTGSLHGGGEWEVATLSRRQDAKLADRQGFFYQHLFKNNTVLTDKVVT